MVCYHSCMKGRSGLGLVELLLAIVILAMGAFALLSLLVTSAQARAKTQASSAARALADGELQRTVHSVRSDQPAGEQSRFWDGEYPAGGTPFVQTTTRVGKLDYEVSVFAETVLSPPSGTNRMKQIEVRVTWHEGQRQGQGLTAVRANGLVCER